MRDKPKLLLVDDNPDNLQVLYHVLKSEYDVRSATSGIDALSLAENLQPDLILLDVMMPAMDGYETCHKLRSLNNLKDTPVIFVTALHEEIDEAKAFDAGAVDFIVKPIKPAIVRKRVALHLALQQKTHQLELRNKELEDAHEKIKALSGIIPICMCCKKIRDDQGYWNQLEAFISEHSDALFSHGYCPECFSKEFAHLRATRMTSAEE